MTSFVIGIADYPRDHRQVHELLSLVELRVGHFAPPTERVLRRWAREAAESGREIAHVWVAWQGFTHLAREIRKGLGVELAPGETAAHLGHFADTAENRRVWAEVVEQAQAAGAGMIMLETPASFTPSAANRARLENFVRSWSSLPEGMRLAWHPAGFWEREVTIEIADACGLLLVVDPLVDETEPMPTGPKAYFQMLGRHGLMDSYSDDDLEALVERAEGYEQVYVSFRTHDAVRDASRLVALVASL